MPQESEQGWELVWPRVRVPWALEPELQAQQEKPARHFGELPKPALPSLVQGMLWALLPLEPEQALPQGRASAWGWEMEPQVQQEKPAWPLSIRK